VDLDVLGGGSLATAEEDRCRKADGALGWQVRRHVSPRWAKPSWKAPGGVPMAGPSHIQFSFVGG
jgi:hypothetical protein